MKENRVGRACLPASLSVHTFQQKNRWTDFDDIWHGLHATGGYTKLVHLTLCGPAI
jgi:hypothetical protein